jgi:hypothetical protein
MLPPELTQQIPIPNFLPFHFFFSEQPNFLLVVVLEMSIICRRGVLVPMPTPLATISCYLLHAWQGEKAQLGPAELPKDLNGMENVLALK